MLDFIEMSVTGGILIAAVVILRAAAGQRLPRGAFLALWGVALLRLLLPFSLPSPTSVYRAADAVGVTVRRAGVASGGAAAAPVGVGTAEAAAGGVDILPLVWGGTALLLGAVFVLAHLRGRREYRASLPVGDPFVAGWLAEHPLRRRVQVRCSDRIDTPLTYGILHPVILLPKGLDRTDEGKLSFVLAHELVHVRRWDALTKCLLCAAVCLHWFNPLVWVMLLLAGRDLEVSCDQSVVRMYGAQSRGPYARTLLELESRRIHPFPLASGFSRNALEERIAAIMKSRKATTLGLIAAVVVVTVVTAVFATSAPREGEGPDAAAGVAGLGTATVVQDAQSGSIRFYQYEADDNWKVDPETGRHYTMEQYNLAASLKKEGYEDLSIAEFNRTLYAALSGGEDGDMELMQAYERVLNDIPEEDPLARFLLNTAQASLNEYYCRLDEVFTGRTKNPSFTGQVTRTEFADVYGDEVQVGYVEAFYSFTYRILDQDKLTVGQRDAFLQTILDGMQAWLDNLPSETLADQKKMEQALLLELDQLGRSASSGSIEYVEGAVENCFADSFYDSSFSYSTWENSTNVVTQGAWS